MSLAVISTHPIQYHAPVYAALQRHFRIPVSAVYGSDFSVAGYRDKEFGTAVRWDTNLTSGYTPIFLSRISQGGARSAAGVSARGLSEALRRIRPAAALLTGYSPRFHRSAFFQVRKTGIPILLRAETTDHALRRGFLRRWMRDQSLRWLYAQCARLLYVGTHSHRHFLRLGCPEEKLIFSPYCVDAAPFRSSEEERVRLRSEMRKRLGFEEADTVILFSGKLCLRKRPDMLLRAIRQLPHEERRKTGAVFLGAGRLRKTLEAQAGALPTVKTHFAGFQNQSQLSPYYHAADLLVLPSLHSETWGLVVNEALCHGLPCVVSEAVGCAPDLVEPSATGEIFQAGSVRSLTAAIQRVLAWRRPSETRLRCREKVSGYSVMNAAAGIAEAYRDVTGVKA